MNREVRVRLPYSIFISQGIWLIANYKATVIVALSFLPYYGVVKSQEPIVMPM